MRSLGIDISHHNGKFVHKGNIDFIFARTSNGVDKDREYKNNLPEIKKVEQRGTYHYYRTNHIEHPVEEQGELFLELSSGKGMSMMAVDYEFSGYDDNVISRETAIELYGFLLYLLQNRPNKWILLYTGIYTWRDVLLPLQGEDTKYGVIDWFIFGIWLPRYGWANDTHILELKGIPVLPYYDIWQKSKTGKGAAYGVESTYVDLNEMKIEEQLPEEETDMKKWYASKTLWFSLLFIITAVAGLFGYADFTPSTQVAEWVQLGMGVLMAILRVYTSKGIEP